MHLIVVLYDNYLPATAYINTYYRGQTMKIMAFVGSPRKGSNTDLLIDQVIEGAKSASAVEVEKVYIYDADIKYCAGCGAHSILQGSKDCPLKAGSRQPLIIFSAVDFLR